MVTSDEGDGDVQPLWLSDEPATTELWTRMHAAHTRSGLNRLQNTLLPQPPREQLR
ncbi:hypothetical protein [Streptomyces chengmaiensis]|uniref:hypothetical protein n=1 Tax=Streptomyces chengmaiensis TaxID=3040919 RepID=UPI002448FBAD|nr:hypothetical protein [Streptomyces chengmaiensis]